MSDIPSLAVAACLWGSVCAPFPRNPGLLREKFITLDRFEQIASIFWLTDEADANLFHLRLLP
jgi:hypothetical protein